ncbi:hypothetical protein EV121DRAFT_263269 [Schizophyllum commune]
MSIMRRKPAHTYRSPTADCASGPIIMRRTTTASSNESTSSESSSTSPPSARTIPRVLRPPVASTVKARRRTSNDHLPLYHPRGKLATSLPPLDALAHGLPIIEDYQLAGGKSGSRAKRNGTSKLRDAVTVAPIAEPAANPPAPAPSKPTPRKRRAAGGGGGSAAAKRKRAAVDDADAPYPATKRRAVRSRQAKDQADVGSPGPAADVPPTPESAAEPLPRNTRGTRARATARRTSSESVGGSVQPQTPRGKEARLVSIDETVVATVNNDKAVKTAMDLIGMPPNLDITVGNAA